MKSGENRFEVALAPSLRSAARSGSLASGRGIGPGDLYKKIRRQPRHQLVVFVVDASDSMGQGNLVRMAAAKGAVLALLQNAYFDRCRVALVAFGGKKAEVLLAPTRSIERARERLRRMPTGGATPLADGLWQGWQLVRRERARAPGLRPLLVILSDGEANVPLTAGNQVMGEVLAVAGRIRDDGIPALVIDTRSPVAKSPEMEQLAQNLGVKCHHISRLRPCHVLDLVRALEG